jgi:hypothetical protein
MSPGERQGMKARFIIALSLLLLLGMSATAAAEATPLWTHAIGGTGVGAVAVSGDGCMVCAAGEDGLICLSAEGKVQWRSPLRMFDVALPDDGSVIVAGGFDIEIFAANGTRVGGKKTFNAIRSVAVSPDGTAYLASTDGSTIVEGMIAGNGATETDTGEDYLAVSLIPGTDYIAAGTESGSVLVTSAGAETVFWEYRASLKPVFGIAAAEDARTIVACTGDGMVTVLSRTGLLLWCSPVDRPEGVAVSRNGDLIGVCGSEGFALYDRSGTKLAFVPTAAGCTAIAMNGDGTRVAVTTADDVMYYSLDDIGGTAAVATVLPTPTVSGTGAEDVPAASPSPASLPSALPEIPAPTPAAPAALGAVAGLMCTISLLRRK